MIASSCALAQKPSVIPLIPAANWRLVSSQKVELDAVRKWAGDPVIEREYGVSSITERVYQLEKVDAQAVLEETSDPSGAYGLLTFYQTETMKPEKSLQLTVSGPQGALMARGTVFIRVRRPADYPLSESDFQALLILIGGTRSAREAVGVLPPPLPPRGLVPGSEKYLMGMEAARRVLPSFRTDFIGFTEGAEVQLASYLTSSTGNARTSLIVINYPTPQIARLRFAAMEKFLKVNQDRGADSLYGRRQGSFVLMVLNSGSQAAATRLLDEFKVSQNVSWDQRYPGDKPITLQVVELILSNLLLVLILVSFAVLGGVLVFVAKRLTARWFPQSPWATPEDGEIIKLNLT